MPGIKGKLTVHVIKQENVTHNQEKKSAVNRSRPQNNPDVQISRLRILKQLS